MPPLLQVISLHKSYKNAHGQPKGSAFEAVRGISFDVFEAECFGLLGPNGAGKSTTIQCISGFYPATAGEVRVLGHNVYHKPKAARKYLGICPQEETLDSDFKVMDQMVRHATYFHVPVKVAKERAKSLLTQFGLMDRADEEIQHLSGGMKRRLQVARALISQPKVLILDEPTTGLDPEVRRILWDVIVECRKNGMAILLSTHYMDEAERLCDRIAILHQGKILDTAPPQTLIQKYVPVETIEEEVRPGVVWKRRPNLEDVYLKLTGRNLEEALHGE